MKLDEHSNPMSGATVYGTLTQVTLEAGTPTLIIAADESRDGALICNTTNEDLFMCLSVSAGLSSTVYSMCLVAKGVLTLSEANVRCAVYGYSVAGGNVTYQVG